MKFKEQWQQLVNDLRFRGSAKPASEEEHKRRPSTFLIYAYKLAFGFLIFFLIYLRIPSRTTTTPGFLMFLYVLAALSAVLPFGKEVPSTVLRRASYLYREMLKMFLFASFLLTSLCILPQAFLATSGIWAPLYTGLLSGFTFFLQFFVIPLTLIAVPPFIILWVIFGDR